MSHATTGRRKLHFETLDEILAEARRLAEAERAGRLSRAGNWSLGKTLNHLAYWAEAAFVEIPLQVPLPIRVVMRLMKGRMLRSAMPAKVRINKSPEGTLGVEEVSTDAGLERLTRALERLKRETPTQPSKAIGKLTREEWVMLTCRHAELHLGHQTPSQQ